MKSFFQFILFLVTISLFLVPSVLAQGGSNANMEILVEKVKADKKLVVAMNLNLSDAEAETFWSVYNSYQADLEKVYQRLVSLFPIMLMPTTVVPSPMIPRGNLSRSGSRRKLMK